MARTKRKRSPSDSANSKRTRSDRKNDHIPSDDDDDDGLQAILARIKDQEESEALAKSLQDEWNGVQLASTSIAGQGNEEAIVIEDDIEDDEAMAKRLSLEWDLEERLSSNSPSKTTSHKKLTEHSQAGPSGGSYTSVDPDLTPDAKLLQFRDLFTANKACTKCGKAVKSPRGHVMFSSNIPPPSLLHLLHAPCTSCRTNHCRGCFTPVACPISCKGKSKNAKCPVETCCAEGRAIAVFEVLGGFDRQYLGERAISDSRAQAAMTKKKVTSRSVGPGGTGYGTDSYNGDEEYPISEWVGTAKGKGKGRGRGGGNDTTEHATKSRADELAAHWEEIISRALIILTHFLPSPYDDSAQAYDLLPHASIGSLISLSQLPELLGSLLRNDSVTDWISRSETYHAMIGLLRRMSDCELTVQVLIGQGWERSKGCGIEEWMWGEGEINWVTEKGSVERTPPLYEHFKKLTRHCEAFLAGASQMMGEGGEEGDDIEETIVKAASICGGVVAARDDMERLRAMTVLGNMPPTTGDTHIDTSPNKNKGGKGKGKGKGNSNGKGKGRAPSVDMEKLYFAACEQLAFKHATLSEENPNGPGLVYLSYNYAPNLNQTASSTRNPKDRLHLIKELAVMATCLPPGVWVRVDEVRNDAIKIMIAGPEDTPYAGGLFEFDCFMPIEYPNKPPLMHLRTTGNGAVRFNPNLYANGKVCLSLLGTWPGRPEEQWSPKSTLLQVLVSIQSMILIDAPYFNEPGHGLANVKAAVSISYNRNVSLQTVRWAMVEWLKDEHRNGIWGDVIASHFTIRNSKISQSIEEWAATDPRIRAYHPSSAATAGTNAPLSSPYTGTKPCTSAQLPGVIDLLKEYERGMRKVQDWEAVRNIA